MYTVCIYVDMQYVPACFFFTQSKQMVRKFEVLMTYLFSLPEIATEAT